MGILLTCVRAAQVRVGAPFVIVTDDLRVSAISHAAERILAPESEVVGSTLLSWISSPVGEERLALTIARAASGTRGDVVSLPVDLAVPEGGNARRLEARVAPCGPPRAALLVLQAPGRS